jgi:hypothetical protein
VSEPDDMKEKRRGFPNVSFCFPLLLLRTVVVVIVYFIFTFLPHHGVTATAQPKTDDISPKSRPVKNLQGY